MSCPGSQPTPCAGKQRRLEDIAHGLEDVTLLDIIQRYAWECKCEGIIYSGTYSTVVPMGQAQPPSASLGWDATPSHL